MPAVAFEVASSEGESQDSKDAPQSDIIKDMATKKKTATLEEYSSDSPGLKISIFGFPVSVTKKCAGVESSHAKDGTINSTSFDEWRFGPVKLIITHKTYMKFKRM